MYSVTLGQDKTVNDPVENGKFRMPTPRNVALTPYMHNGVFMTLEDVVSFYNIHDITDWPALEVTEIQPR